MPLRRDGMKLKYNETIVNLYYYSVSLCFMLAQSFRGVNVNTYSFNN